MRWKKYVVTMECNDCKRELDVLKYRVSPTIERLGFWVCKACSTSRRNRESARQIGSTRIHKQSGYILEKDFNGEWRRQHMLVMERSINRRLLPHENVHHINEIKTDNRLENLELTNFSDHTREHHKGKVVSKEAREKIRNALARIKGIKTNKEVCESIRDEYSKGNTTQKDIAEKYGISIAAVSRAINRKTWQ